MDIVGIDLGTTNSLIGAVEAGFPLLLANEDGQRLVPSAVYFPPDGSAPLVGAAALRRRALEAERTVVSVKRLMGCRRGEWDHSAGYKVAADRDGQLQVQMGDKMLLPEEVSALILSELKRIAELRLERPVHRAVITVPAYFNDAQRQATKRAGELAGFQVQRILNEPTAAALAYGLDKLKEHSKIAVYDLGGGTFDLSILELNAGVFQVLSTHGDTRLGGDDLDHAVQEALLQEIYPNGIPPAMARARLLEAAVAAKHALSTQDETEISIPFLDQDRHFHRRMTRSEFEKIARPILERTRRHCLQTLADARLRPEEIDQVILVGGSTRIPLVRQLVAEIFGREPNTTQNPDETVATGAVVQAGLLSGQFQHMTLLDVTPLSLGIETFGGLMNTILPRNTTIPCKAGELFTNAVDGQQSMLIRVLQGEREMAKDNWDLGHFQVDFTSSPRGSARVGVQFTIDADGILQVLARDTRTMKDKVLEIRHSAVQVDDAKVEAMIAESVEHAFEDMSERQLTEAKLKAAELLQAVESALTQAGAWLSPVERESIAEAAGEVRDAVETGTLPRLKTANQRLDDATESLAAMLVEKAMEESMRRRGLLT